MPEVHHLGPLQDLGSPDLEARDLPTPNVPNGVQVRVCPEGSVDPMDPDVQEANVVRPMVSRPFASDYPGATIWWVEDDLELCRLVAPSWWHANGSCMFFTILPPCWLRYPGVALIC